LSYGAFGAAIRVRMWRGVEHTAQHLVTAAGGFFGSELVVKIIHGRGGYHGERSISQEIQGFYTISGWV
jgi:hypothetical protein